MVSLLITWLVSALALLIVAYIIPGIRVDSFTTALIAALVIGLVNATIGFILKILTLPLTIVTLGLFLLVINALMLMLAAKVVKGFEVSGFLSALVGSILLSLVTWAIRAVLPAEL